MVDNRVFVSSATFDVWVSAGTVELAGTRLTARATGLVYDIQEAVHVVREVSGERDTARLVGTVQRVEDLVPLGAELLDRSLVLGDLAFDVVPGFLLRPLGDGGRSGEVLAALSGLSDRLSAPKSDEELLARYLIEKLE